MNEHFFEIVKGKSLFYYRISRFCFRTASIEIHDFYELHLVDSLPGLSEGLLQVIRGDKSSVVCVKILEDRHHEVLAQEPLHFDCRDEELGVVDFSVACIVQVRDDLL